MFHLPLQTEKSYTQFLPLLLVPFHYKLPAAEK
jgi:hypothetical protein